MIAPMDVVRYYQAIIDYIGEHIRNKRVNHLIWNKWHSICFNYISYE
jgi:hypothetical protein